MKKAAGIAMIAAVVLGMFWGHVLAKWHDGATFFAAFQFVASAWLVGLVLVAGVIYGVKLATDKD